MYRCRAGWLVEFIVRGRCVGVGGRRVGGIKRRVSMRNARRNKTYMLVIPVHTRNDSCPLFSPLDVYGDLSFPPSSPRIN